jgi:nucleoside-diphosphate-sugar epimerase
LVDEDEHMRILVLGGTRFVGRAFIEAAVAAGADVTAVNRGVTGATPVGAREARADRTTPEGVARIAGLAENADAVVDTWSGAPRVMSAVASTIASQVPRYVYVSTRSVYDAPLQRGANETAPVVDADPDADVTGYAADKRGAELAVLRDFGADRSVLLRAGLILGPYEDIGRLPWWLTRIARGGEVLAPGPADLPLQYLDARDLADFMLRCIDTDLAGAYNVVSRRGHATMRGVLETCVSVTESDARLVWAEPDSIRAANIAPWTELPIWLPPDDEDAALHDGDVSKAIEAGLHCRALAETVRDTWEWVRSGGWSGPRPDRFIGLDPAKEQAALAAHRKAQLS